MTATRLATLNINGLAPNKNEVELLLTEHNLDVLLLSEAHCTKSTSVKFREYTCYMTPHPDGTGHAGTAIIVRKSVKHHLMPKHRSPHIQATTIAVKVTGGYLSVSAVYCPPKHKITKEMYSDYFQTLGNRFVAGGDWNAKHTHWGSRLITTRGRQLKASLDDNKLWPISACEPTYWPTDPKKIPDLLDFFVTKGLTRQYMKSKSCHDSISDHTPVLLTISSMLIECERPATLYTKHTDWDRFRDYLNENIELKIALKSPNDIEKAAKYITELIQLGCWLNTPKSENQETKRYNKFPLEIKNTLLEKRRLRRVWHQSRLETDKTAWNRESRKLKLMLHNWENDTLKTQMEALTATASTNYSLWKFTKNYDRPLIPKPPLRKRDGWARSPQEKADTFAEHLSKVFHPNDAGDLISENEIDRVLEADFQMSSPPSTITVREVWKTIQKLKNKKAPGFDLITKEVLQQLPRRATVFLTTLYNGILRVQYYPLLWKVSQVLMIHKPGKPANEVTSYRPISLLPILSKVFEKLLLHQIRPILEEHKVIPNHQFGFRQQHSTIEQVHRVVDRIRKSLEEKEYCSSAFLDIQQAFDKVWHKGLLCKVKSYLPHSYYLLFSSYLNERMFQVKELDKTSGFYEIKAGVPQGSVLGPVLYTIYTADLPEIANITTATFADDTAILASNKDPVAATQILQKGLHEITKWLRKWRIKPSASKSIQVTFTLRKGNCPPVTLENNTLPQQDSVRYLGLHLDRRLTWNHHIKTKREELNIRYKNLYWIMGRNSKLAVDNKLLIYKTMLKPVWLYGIQLWGSASNSNISILQRIQNSILRAICTAPWFATNMEIHKYLSMPTVKEEITNVTQGYRWRLENHPNELATRLTNKSYGKRLKRKDILQL
jgi:hypothetical protein